MEYGVYEECLICPLYPLLLKAISELLQDSVSKQGLVLSYGYGNDFLFSCK